jgi:DNA-binding CsgD family transcriptional regulator/PAS domain-containing protein
MDCTEDAVLLLAADLSIRRANRCASLLTGYTKDDLRLMRLPELIEPGERSRIKAAIKGMSRRCGGNTVLRPRARAARPIKYCLCPAQGDDGRSSGYLFVFRPRRLDPGIEKFAEALERRKKVMESIGEPVFILDSTSRAIMDLNKCAVVFSGYRSSDIVGKPLIDFLRPLGDAEAAAGIRECADAAYSARGFYRGVVGFARRGGAVVPCDCYSFLLLKDDGLPEYMIVALFDRTEAERREAEFVDFAYRAARFASELADFARSGSGRREGRRLSDLGFTPRQIEIARLVSEGRPSKEIGRQLGIAESTVKNHLAAMFKKLEASSRVDFLHKLVEGRIWIA